MFRVVVLLLLLVLVALGGYAVFQYNGNSEVDQERRDMSQNQKEPGKVGPKHEELQRQLDEAVDRIQQDSDSKAWEEVERLAKAEPVFLPVHRYLVEHLIAENRARRDGSVLGKLMHHLRIVADSGDDEANVILGRLYMVIGQRQQGIETLRRVVDRRPEVSTLLARALVAEGRTEESERLVESMTARYRERLANDASDLKSRLGLVDNLSDSDRYEEATQVLREGLTQHPGLLALTMESAVRHSDAIKDSRPAIALELLERAAQDDPTDLAMWSRIVAMSDSEEIAIAERANGFIKRSQKQQQGNGNLEMVLGSHAFVSGDFAKAIDHLEKAHSLSPENPLVTSTLANYLAKADPPELDRALRLISKVLDDFPERKEFYLTRGRTLSLLERADEAIIDLKEALEAMPRNAEVISLLCNLLEKRGDNATAAALRETIPRPDRDGDKNMSPSIDALLNNAAKE